MELTTQTNGEPARAMLRERQRGILQRWPRGVRLVILSAYSMQTTTAIVLGSLFDVYLKILGGTNMFVGELESARGLSALALAVPLGWAVDRWPKTRVLRCNNILGLVSALLLLLGIPADNVPLICIGSVVWAIHNQCLYGCFPALIGEMTEPGEQRVQVMSHFQSASSAGLASGPALQLLLMWVTKTSNWTTSELHWVLCLGMLFWLVHTPLVWSIRPEDHAVAGSTASARINGESGSETPWPRKYWAIALLVETCSLITAIGSGMTFKYWPLFFKGDFGFSPMGVCAVTLGTWACISACSQISPKLAKGVGRAPASMLLHVVATSLLFLISLKVMSAGLTVVCVLSRNAMMNSIAPLLQSILLDMVPQKHRGKWSAIASLRRTSWSGSALLGGDLSDSHDYRFAFLITACFHCVSGAVMLVLTVLRP